MLKSLRKVSMPTGQGSIFHILFTCVSHLLVVCGGFYICFTFVLHFVYNFGPKAPKDPWALWGLGAQKCKQNVK